jgi:hypothetical protein
MRAPLGLDAARNFAALQQEKVPGQRKQSEAEKRRERQRFVRLDDVLLRGHTRRIWKDVVFVGDNAATTITANRRTLSQIVVR